MSDQNQPVIMLVDDDPEDRLLLRHAFQQAPQALKNPPHLVFAEDGEELLDYLKRRPPYQNAETNPLPNLILLDINMPRFNGRMALKEIKDDPELGKIPLVVLSTSSQPADINWSYATGAASYCIKPAEFEGLKNLADLLYHYWFQVMQLPQG